MDNIQEAFFALLRAGLWESDVRLSSINKVDFTSVCRLAEEQSVVGLVAAGIEHVVDFKVPQEISLQFAGQTIQLEQRNSAMNRFIGSIVDKMREIGIYTLLLKGQGIAQCYERPLWRACGDVDLFLSEDNYKKAKAYLKNVANHVGQEEHFKKHMAFAVDQWEVELHGSLRRGLSPRINKVLDEIKVDTFYGGDIRSWLNGNTQVFLLSPDNDIIYVFIHYLSHFYGGGIGLRQICDWVRLLWTYKDMIDDNRLKIRLRKMGVFNQWKAFGAFAVDYLGMPIEAMPLYSPQAKWKRKSEKICSFVLEVGNFGHNRDYRYYNNPFLIRKAISFGRRCRDVFRHTRIFPNESLRFFPYMMFNGVRAALKGEHND